VKEIKIGALAAADRSSLRGAALLAVSGTCNRWRLLRHRLPFYGAGRLGRAKRTPLAERGPTSTRSSAPTSATTSPPRLSSAMGMIAAATGDTASKYVARRETPLFIPRELHTVHGVHLGLPGYRAAQLLPGLEHAALNRRFLLHCRPGRPRQPDERAA